MSSHGKMSHAQPYFNTCGSTLQNDVQYTHTVALNRLKNMLYLQNFIM